jgi:hypothetical protein
MQNHIQAGRDQPIADRAQPRRLLGVVMTHVVQRAVGMGNVSDRHKSASIFD